MNHTVDMGSVYDDFSTAFGEADKLPTWRFVGKPAMERLLERFFEPDTLFLEFGSASARVEVGVLQPHGVPAVHMTGVEISPEQVEMARTRLPGARFLVGDIADPTLLLDEGGVYDVIFSHMVFEHLDDFQLATACANAHRLLKTGGTLAFVVTHPDKMTDINGNLVQIYGAFITTAPWGGTLHNWRRSVGDTRQIVTRAGFTVDSVDELQFPDVPPFGTEPRELPEFIAAAAKYRKYPAIRLAIAATKI